MLRGVEAKKIVFWKQKEKDQRKSSLFLSQKGYSCTGAVALLQWLWHKYLQVTQTLTWLFRWTVREAERGFSCCSRDWNTVSQSVVVEINLFPNCNDKNWVCWAQASPGLPSYDCCDKPYDPRVSLLCSTALIALTHLNKGGLDEVWMAILTWNETPLSEIRLNKHTQCITHNRQTLYSQKFVWQLWDEKDQLEHLWTLMGSNCPNVVPNQHKHYNAIRAVHVWLGIVLHILYVRRKGPKCELWLDLLLTLDERKFDLELLDLHKESVFESAFETLNSDFFWKLLQNAEIK